MGDGCWSWPAALPDRCAPGESRSAVPVATGCQLDLTSRSKRSRVNRFSRVLSGPDRVAALLNPIPRRLAASFR